MRRNMDNFKNFKLRIDQFENWLKNPPNKMVIKNLRNIRANYYIKKIQNTILI